MLTEEFQVDNATQFELRDRVKRFLDSQHFASFRKLAVATVGDSVILDGSVPSFHERQMAVALCQHVAGVQQVIDRLIVSSPDAIQQSAGMRRRPN